MKRAPKNQLHNLLLGTSCLVASALIAFSPALAGPTGGDWVSGHGKITKSGGTTTIDQTSNKGFIDWNSFSIGAGQTVKFDQPGKGSVTVNRVTGGDPSKILGELLANGNIWLINGNGILFGKGSIINVGSLIATTSDITDDDFKNGKYRFKKGGNPNASVINQGTITAADGGSVVLSAAHVANEGVIQANLGKVVLGGANAFTVDLNGDNLIRYQVTSEVTRAPVDSKGDVQKALVSNSGKIIADGGTVLMTSRAASNVQDNVVNNSGIVEATSVSSHDGEVVLSAGPNGTVEDSGTVNVSGTQAGETGGVVTMTGRNITVADGAHIDAEGYDGGGTVRIGGNFHGQGNLHQARNVIIGKAVINVSATHRGDGGKVAIWSRGDTSFAGTIDAMGGRYGGNGGYVETSGHGLSIAGSGLVKTSATDGNAGTWLLDPMNVIIEDCGGSCCGAALVIDSTAIANSLTGGTNITVEAVGGGGNSTIVVSTNSSINANGSGTLSLLAQGSITIESSIENAGNGGINLVAGWDGTTGISGSSSTAETNTPVNISAILTTPGAYGNNNSGSVDIGNGSQTNAIYVGSEGGSLTVAAFDVNLEEGAGVPVQLGYHGNGGGNIVVDATDDLTLTADNTSNQGYVLIGNGDFLESDSSITSVTGNITVNVAKQTSLDASSVSGVAIGNFDASGGTEIGNVTLTTKDLSGLNDFANFIGEDLNGGNVTIEITDPTGTTTLPGTDDYSSANTLKILAEGSLVFQGDIQNSGAGAIYLIGGWDGTTTMASRLTNSGVFGNNEGSITIGGANASGNVAVGSNGGTTTVAADDVTLDGEEGFAQIGFSGGGATGAIAVDATGNVDLDADADYAQIGHGGANTSGSESGNITVDAQGAVNLVGGSDIDAYAQIGHGGNSANNDPSASFSYTGTIDVTGASVALTGGAGTGAYVQIGHGGAGVGDDPSVAITEIESGNIDVTATDGSVTLLAGAGNSYAQIGHGGAFNGIIFSGTPDVVQPTVTHSGNITVQATGGSVTLTAAGTGSDQSDYALIGNGGDATLANDSGNIIVSADDNITLTAGDGQPSGVGYQFAQIGNGGGKNSPGSDGGNITLTAGGNLILTGSTANSSDTDYVQIGNGSALNLSGTGDGPATGNISIDVSGFTRISSSSGASDVWIGNIASSGDTESGTVTLTTNTLLTNLDQNQDFGKFIAGDLSGGNVTLEITDPTATTTLLDRHAYSSANTLKILAEGSLVFDGSIQNSGSGAIDLVAGWNGTTTSMTAILANPSVDFGLSDGSITVSPAFGSGGAAIGSASGTTTVAADNIFVEGSGAGFAQIGYHGAGGGTIDVQAVGNVTVESGTNGDSSGNGQIGNGNANGSGGNATGNITVNAGGNIVLETDANSTMAAIGNVTDDATSSESGNITITAGGGVSLETPSDSSVAFIGNWSRDNTTGGASGNISITSASLDIQNSSSGSESVIGNGGQSGYNFNNAGAVSGDITIHTGTMTLTATGAGGSDYSGGQARIGNRGYNAVSGDIGITTSGDTTLQANGDDIAAIGNASYSGTSTGNINVTVAGALSLLSTDTGVTSIGGYASSGTNVDVTVTGDILLKVTGNPEFEGSYYRGGEAVIGNFAASKNAPGGNVTVASTHGSITLDSEEKYGSTQIGNTSGKTTGSTITVTAADSTNGSIELLANGKYSSAQIGSRGIDSTFDRNNQSDANIAPGLPGELNSPSGSKVIVTAGADLEISGDNTDAVAQIGNGGGKMNGNASGNLTINVGGNLTISSNGTDAASVIGNGDPLNDGTGSASGNINIDVTGVASLAGPGLVWVGNLADTGVESGNVSVIVSSGVESGGVDFKQMVIADLGTTSSAGSGGNVTVGFTNPNASINFFGGNFDYDSPNALMLLTAGSIDFTGSLQNSGAGDVTVVAGWDSTVAPSQVLATSGSYGNGGGSVTIGGASAAGNAVVGSAGGTTTVLADNVTLDSENGYAQLGYHGNGTGDIDVDATGNITLTGNTSGGFVSQIGNGGSNVTGNVGGNITLVTTGGTLDVDALGDSSIATIGALSDGGASNESGNISIDTHGGALNLVSSGSESFAQIGDWAPATNTGTLSSNITIHAGAISLDSTGEFSSSQIGNGNYLIGGNSGAISGNIDINATTLSVAETAPSGGFEEARIGNLGTGPVSGMLDVTTTGNVAITADGNGAASIGNYSNPRDSGNNEIQGEGTGSVDIQSGGNITVSSDGSGGYASIEIGGAASGTVDVTAKGNVTETASNGAGALIGSLEFDDGGVDVDVTSKTGNIDIETNGTGSFAQVGNTEFLTSGAVSGNVTMTASEGNIVIAANGPDSDAIHVGDTAATGGTASGNLTFTAGNVFDIVNSAGSVIGNSGGTDTGNVTITAASLTGDINPSIENDLPGGDFTLTLTGDDTLTMSADIAYDSSHNLILSNGGDIDFAGSVQNSGTGDITVNSAGTVLVGGTGATGDVSVGSAGGTTTVLAKNVLLEADNGYAQIGFNGASGGDIDIVASGNVTLDGGNTSFVAQIGNGSTLDSSSTGGNVDLTAHSVNASGSADIAGDSADIILTGQGGHIGSASDPLGLAVNTLAILASGANAYLTSPQGLSIGVGGNGIDLGSGDLVLTASGPVTQTDAIVAGGIDIDATSGAITLTNAGNTFDMASLTTTGDASLYDSTALTIAGATIGGTLTLSDAGNIGQSGAIDADTLDVTASNGSVTLTNTANTFSTATLSASKNASLYDASDLTIAGATVGNMLTLAGGGNIGQSGAIDADTLDVTASNGSVTLTNTANTFSTATLSASKNASLYDASDLTIAGATVGNMLTLAGGGNIGQSGAIDADTLDVTASNGSVTLTNTGNTFNTATLSASKNASLYDASDLTIAGANVGKTLTLAGGGNIGQSGAIDAGTLDVTASNGSVTLTNTGNTFNTATLSASKNASLYDASDLTIAGANVGKTLTLAGGGNIGQSGAIDAGTLDVAASNGSVTLTNTGNTFNTATLSASNNASLYDSSNLTIAGATAGNTLTLASGGNIGQSGAIDAKVLDATATNGAITLTDAGNAIGTASLSAKGNVSLYDSKSLTVAGAATGGDLTLLTEGNLTFVSSIQLKNGDILAVAGWDGTTTSPSALTHAGAYGNNGGSIIVGGAQASGDVAIGSEKGTVTLAGDDVSLEAQNGYAQIGYHGSGQGDIDMFAKGAVTLDGGSATGEYAQIGNGGFNTSGNESGNITVDAGGNVTLDGGKGTDAYAQIGHGGADADKNSHGYTNSGTITIEGQTVALVAGAGDQSYAQIGNGGFDLGDGLTGQGVNEGNITVTAVDGVSLTGNGTDAYAQIGNGGGDVNLNAGSNAGGSNSGNVTVNAGTGTVALTAGVDGSAYVQIGNGGFDINASSDADPSNFQSSGTITVSDLTMTGSDSGNDGYAQVGNGDASLNGIGDVSGNITIDAGTITLTNGSADNSPALIGNATGSGTVTGTITGYTPPPSNGSSPSQGSVTSIIQQTTQTGTQQVNVVVTTQQITLTTGDTGTTTPGSGPLEQLTGDDSGSGIEASDSATGDLGQSLSGHRHGAVSLIPGVLTEVADTQTAHGIPPANQDFSSWGNEALWRW